MTPLHKQPLQKVIFDQDCVNAAINSGRGINEAYHNTVIGSNSRNRPTAFVTFAGPRAQRHRRHQTTYFTHRRGDSPHQRTGYTAD